MKKLTLIAVLLAVSPVYATQLRVPLSLLSTQCGNGRCYPTAYYDTNRSWSYMRDWACQAHTYNQHDGIDYGVGGFPGMDQGRWVMSAAAGTVIAVHDGEYDRCTTGNCGQANYVKIRHADGKITWYWHLKKWSIRVRVGQYVGCGAQIAQVGSSGYTTGPHLHFGVQANGSSTVDDPYAAVSSACGGTYSWWTSQGVWKGLPGNTCG
jgi:murein DD-endopeptidase MepM/ murein hydrolase activator NlpD